MADKLRLPATMLVLVSVVQTGRAGDTEHETQAALRQSAAKALENATRSFPHGHMTVVGRLQQFAAPADHEARVTSHYARCLKIAWDRIMARPPTTDDESNMMALVAQQFSNPEAGSIKPCDDSDSFGFSTGPGGSEFWRPMGFELQPGWSDGSATLRVQYLDRELIYRLNTGWTQAGVRRSIIDVTRQNREPSDFQRTAASPYWQFAYVLPKAMLRSLSEAATGWRFAKSGGLVTASWSAPHSQSPWPSVAFFNAAPGGGTLTATIDPGTNSLVRWEVADLAGTVVERIVVAKSHGDEHGCLPLEIDRTTWYPRDDNPVRSHEVFHGQVSMAVPVTPLALMVPPTARVTDKRVSPHVVYTQAAVPVSDDRVVELSAKAAEKQDSAAQRTDPGVAPAPSPHGVPESASAMPSVTRVGGISGWLVAVGVLALAGAVLVAIRQWRQSRRQVP